MSSFYNNRQKQQETKATRYKTIHTNIVSDVCWGQSDGDFCDSIVEDTREPEQSDLGHDETHTRPTDRDTDEV